MSLHEVRAAVGEAVMDVTQNMNAARRRASRAVLLEGLKPREAAAEVGLDAKTVGWAVRRARREITRAHSARLRAYI